MVEQNHSTIWRDENQAIIPMSDLNTDEVIDGEPTEELKSYSDLVVENKEAVDLLNKHKGLMKS